MWYCGSFHVTVKLCLVSFSWTFMKNALCSTVVQFPNTNLLSLLCLINTLQFYLLKLFLHYWSLNITVHLCDPQTRLQTKYAIFCKKASVKKTWMLMEMPIKKHWICNTACALCNLMLMKVEQKTNFILKNQNQNYMTYLDKTFENENHFSYL